MMTDCPIQATNDAFHLQTKNTSYVMRIAATRHLLHVYYGRRIRQKDDYSSLYQPYGIEVGSTIVYDAADRTYSLDTAKLEFPTFGKGDYREVALHVTFDDSSSVCDFLYQEHHIYAGKPSLQDLPHTFGDDAWTLEITLYDAVADVYAKLMYSVFADCDAVARSVQLINGHRNTLRINKLMSASIDFSETDFDAITLDGKWIKERHINRHGLKPGVFHIDSKKGVSSANHNPFLCLARKQTNENTGDCYGFGLVYSGNHQALAEISPHGLTRVQLGINPYHFEWRLGYGESFQTPEVVMTFAHEGLQQMSRNFHQLIQRHLIPPAWQERERPVLINNWEATYFDFNERKLLKLAKVAQKLGIELFVLDDGWFGKRSDDTTSLGDWYENLDKLPSGLEGLSQKINEIGLDFGLWVEPEMISVESELYKQHPDWALQHPNRAPSFGRNQLILDLANPNVVDYLSDMLIDLFRRANVTYVKWDMNRNFSDHFSAYLGTERQQEMTHRYVLGLYQILARLKEAFPDVLFESCASGGNRFDLGMLYYMPQTWTSDNTDAVERQYIQYGTSIMYPLSTMGAHVSAAPSHQALRTTPIETRFNVAAFGLLGYELDLTLLNAFDRKVIKAQIAFYKKHRKLLQLGTFYRLESPFESNRCIWMVVSPDQDEAILGYYQKLQESSPGPETIRLQGLAEDGWYEMQSRTQYVNIRTFGMLINRLLPIKLKENGVIHTIASDHYMFKMSEEKIAAYGDELMYAGFRPYTQFIGTGLNDQVRFIGDFGSRLYYLKRAEK